MNILTENFEIYMRSPGEVTIVAFNTRLANKINLILNYYDCSIKDGDEAKFNMSLHKFDTLRAQVRALKRVEPVVA